MDLAVNLENLDLTSDDYVLDNVDGMAFKFPFMWAYLVNDF